MKNLKLDQFHEHLCYVRNIEVEEIVVTLLITLDS